MTRQITEQAVASFMADRNFNLSNTMVISNAEGMPYITIKGEEIPMDLHEFYQVQGV